MLAHVELRALAIELRRGDERGYASRRESSRRVGAEHVAGDEFTLWIPAALTDLKAIEREAYRQLRAHLALLGSTLPGDRTLWRAPPWRAEQAPDQVS
jgi:hypothetical protein